MSQQLILTSNISDSCRQGHLTGFLIMSYVVALAKPQTVFKKRVKVKKKW